MGGRKQVTVEENLVEIIIITDREQPIDHGKLQSELVVPGLFLCGLQRRSGKTGHSKL